MATFYHRASNPERKMAAQFPMYAILAQQTERTRGSSTSQIKELIAESDSRVDSLQNQIAALESRVAALVELRDRERAAGDALRSLTAPIRTLPAELLVEIFFLSIREPDESGYIFSKLVHIQDAFCISHVCRHWRQIANNTPRLWTGPIRVDIHREGPEGIYVEGLETWLARSAPLPVPITLMRLEDGPPFIESSRVTEALLCISARWRSLRFACLAPASFVQRLVGSRLDSLEELVLLGVDRHSFDSYPDPTAISSFATAPRLRKVTVDSTCGIPMPWVQLTDITLENVLSPRTFRSIFSQCPNVVKASIEIQWFAVTPDALALNQLRILSVTWAGEEVDGMQFLHCLSAPALDDLLLYFQEGEDGAGWDEAAFTAFQLRSPNITKLKIDGEGLSAPSHALINALQHAASLTHLTITNCPNSVDDHFCQALCYTDDAEPLVPRLHTLAVAEREVDFSQEGLANMIASRWWPDAELASRLRPPAVARWRQIRLRDESIHGGFDFSPEFRDAIYELQQTGLDVDFIELGSWRLDR
ncbi:F-box domain-containing protein [Mycena sanguinolenta]|uniref:F-box domain-containing protein n=1 Tax=Mycena sanguinolenta TaxID=230812 RepID=A0A8H6YAR5_9AGAR|nr:F-box domain-containing protein [Mycena sanguinolenta]